MEIVQNELIPLKIKRNTVSIKEKIIFKLPRPPDKHKSVGLGEVHIELFKVTALAHHGFEPLWLNYIHISPLQNVG